MDAGWIGFISYISQMHAHSYRTTFPLPNTNALFEECVLDGLYDDELAV